MSDNAQTTPVNSGKDPLAVLEGILQDAKKKGGSKPVNSSALSPDDVAGENSIDTDQQVEIDPAVAAQLKMERDAEEAKRLAEQAAQLEQYRQKMQGEIKNTDAYKARESQDEDEKNEQANPADSDGFQIDQVEHKKI